MILFLFFLLIILVIIFIYKNNFSNKEGNTIFFKTIENKQHLTRDSVTKEIQINTFGDTDKCTKLQTEINDSLSFNDILTYFKKSEKKPNLGEIKDSCNLNDYGNTGIKDSNNISFDVNTTLLGSNKDVVCSTNKKLKGNLYCKYGGGDEGIGELEIIGDISCVDVSDFIDENWYKNVKNYSFEYTNDGSKDILHYICKSGTGINGVVDKNVGSIKAINWRGPASQIYEETKCKCPDKKFYYGGKCNAKTQHSTDEKNEDVNGKKDRIISDHPLPECKGKWLQVEKCTKLSPTTKPTFKAKFIYEQGNGIPSGGRNDTTCTESAAKNGVLKEEDDYYKIFDCDTSCGKWVADSFNVCGSNLNTYIYKYKDEIINKKNECFFELPEIPGIRNCQSTPIRQKGEYNKPPPPPPPKCSVLPMSMNGSKHPRGCPGAVWSNGGASRSYCTNGKRFPWWKDCCKWDKTCVPKYKLS